MRYRILILVSLIMLLPLVGCSKWTRNETVDINASHPWERDPQLWEQYKADLRAYKQRGHSLVYVRFDNAAEKPGSEKNFMRSLPDSLDFVSLANAVNFSAYDAEDMEWMRSVGTKVLYGIDLSQQADLEKAEGTVKENRLDGFSLSGITRENSDQVPGIVSRLHGSGLLVCEGNPTLLPEDVIEKMDLFVLATESIENSYSLNNTILDAIEHGVPREKIVLAASMDGTWYDSSNAEKPVVPAMADNVVSFGPLAGLAIYDIMSDYYHYEGNWITIRSIISRLNP